MTTQSMTEGGQHKGVSYFMTVSKTDSKYKAMAVIAWQEGSEAVSFNEPGTIDLVEAMAGRPSVCRGEHSYYANPFAVCVQCLTGYMDATLDMKRLASAITAENAHTFSNDDLMMIINFKRRQENIMKKTRMKPETNPTPEQLEQMATEVDRLIRTFSVPGLAALTGMSGPTINQWKERGRVGAQAAHEICKIKQISAHEFTRERLRPDVAFWYVDVQ